MAPHRAVAPTYSPGRAVAFLRSGLWRLLSPNSQFTGLHYLLHSCLFQRAILLDWGKGTPWVCGVWWTRLGCHSLLQSRVLSRAVGCHLHQRPVHRAQAAHITSRLSPEDALGAVAAELGCPGWVGWTAVCISLLTHDSLQRAHGALRLSGDSGLSNTQVALQKSAVQREVTHGDAQTPWLLGNHRQGGPAASRT